MDGEDDLKAMEQVKLTLDVEALLVRLLAHPID
jgi:hypothetical protein